MDDTGIGGSIDSLQNVTIDGNLIRRARVGINSDYTQNCMISNNTINNTTLIGIGVIGRWNVIENNIVSFGQLGIDMRCENSIFHNNTMRDNYCGFEMDVSCENTKIRNNLVKGNFYAGEIDRAERNHFYANDIIGNTYGIRIQDHSKWNRLYYNNFISNTNFNMDNKDWSIVFNTTIRGNYWDNWTSPDANNDWIVDNRHCVEDNGIDYFPLTLPYGTMIITSTDDTHSLEDELYWSQYSVFAKTSTMAWKVRSNATWLNISQVGNLTGNPTNDDVGSFYVNVTVDDGKTWDFTNFTLEVENVNDDPEIITDVIPNGTRNVDYAVFIEVEDIDPTDDIISWSIKDSNAGFLTMDSGTGNLSGIPGISDTGEKFIIINVTDGLGGYDEKNFTFSIAGDSNPPILIGMDNGEAIEDEDYWNQYSVTDIDVGDTNFIWTLNTNAGFLHLDTTGNLSGTPTNDDVGGYYVNVTVMDQTLEFDYANFTLNVVNVNDDPILNGSFPSLIFEEDLFWAQPNATDPDPGVTNFVWEFNTNASWIGFCTTSGNASGVPDDDEVGLWFLNWTLCDGLGGETFFNTTIEVINVDDPPEWSAVPHYEVILVEKRYSNQLSTIDVDTPMVVYELESLPSYGMIVTFDGLIEWTPEKIGEYKFNVSASDDTSSIYHEFILKVVDYFGYGPNATLIYPEDEEVIHDPTPTFTWSIDPNGHDDVKVDLIIFTDNNYPMSKSGFLLIIQNISGESYTLEEPLDLNITYYWYVDPLAEEGIQTACLNGHRAFIIQVSKNTPPRFTSTPDTLIPDGEFLDHPWAYTPTAFDDDGDDVTISLITDHEGLSYLNGTLYYVLALYVSNVDVLLVATDGKDSTVQNFTIHVEGPPYIGPSLGHIPHLTVSLGETLHYQLIIDDEDSDRFNFIVQGESHAQVEINGTGYLSWKPSREDVGENEFNIIVDDGWGSDSRTVRITVKDDQMKINATTCIIGGLICGFILILVVMITTYAVLRNKTSKSSEPDAETENPDHDEDIDYATDGEVVDDPSTEDNQRAADPGSYPESPDEEEKISTVVDEHRDHTDVGQVPEIAEISSETTNEGEGSEGSTDDLHSDADPINSQATTPEKG